MSSVSAHTSGDLLTIAAAFIPRARQLPLLAMCFGGKFAHLTSCTHSPNSTSYVRTGNWKDLALPAPIVPPGTITR